MRCYDRYTISLRKEVGQASYKCREKRRVKVRLWFVEQNECSLIYCFD